MPGTARRQESDHFPYLASLNAERSPTRSFDHRVTHGGHGKKDGKSGRRGASDGKTASRPKRRSDRIPSPCTSGMPHAAGQSVPTRWHRR